MRVLLFKCLKCVDNYFSVTQKIQLLSFLYECIPNLNKSNMEDEIDFLAIRAMKSSSFHIYLN